MARQQVLVTGAAGYVAGQFVSHLQARHDVTLTDARAAPDRPEFSGLEEVDLLENSDRLAELMEGVDTVIHTAFRAPADHGASGDAHHVTAPPEDGGGAVLAMRRALEDAGAAPGDVDHVNAHGTSTPLNDKAEALALRAVLGAHTDEVAVTSTKGVTGHLLGAAGGVEAAFSVLAIRDGLVPPTANVETLDPEIDLDVVRGSERAVSLRTALCNSFGFGGQNASLLFSAA
jgi:hypothetical protein